MCVVIVMYLPLDAMANSAQLLHILRNIVEGDAINMVNISDTISTPIRQTSQSVAHKAQPTVHVGTYVGFEAADPWRQTPAVNFRRMTACAKGSETIALLALRHSATVIQT
jgi:hypothetical protein